MINNQSIKGEYLFDINIYTMFDVFNVCIKNTNLITSAGLNFFLSKTVHPPIVEDGEIIDDFGYIGYIAIGTSSISAELSDTSLIEETKIFNDSVVKIDENKIILTVETVGSDIDNTSEIGVYSTKSILISRDVHERYTMPSTSSVKITYTYTLNQYDKSKMEEEVDYND